jgi:hypothetical protein
MLMPQSSQVRSICRGEEGLCGFAVSAMAEWPGTHFITTHPDLTGTRTYQGGLPKGYICPLPAGDPSDTQHPMAQARCGVLFAFVKSPQRPSTPCPIQSDVRRWRRLIEAASGIILGSMSSPGPRSTMVAAYFRQLQGILSLSLTPTCQAEITPPCQS